MPQKEVDKRSSITFFLFVFGHFLVTSSDASVIFHHFFARLLLPDSLWQGEEKHVPRLLFQYPGSFGGGRGL